MRPSTSIAEPTQREPVWPALLAGIMATLVGIGLARFAYTPLIPVLVQADWFTASDAVYLGAANLLGYLIGALSAHRLTERFAPNLVVPLCLVVIVSSFLLCAWPAGFYWFFVWRVLSGVAGAILMVVVPSLALSRTPAGQRTLVGTLVFSGIGIGAALSAVVVPALLSLSLSVTWLTLAGLSFVCAVACDVGLRRMPKNDQIANQNLASVNHTDHAVAEPARLTRAIVVLVMLAYALDAAGFVPHTVFWVDYLARENEFGQAAASWQWAIFGLGATCGPLLVGLAAQRFGLERGLTYAFLIKAIAIMLPVMSLALTSQVLSSFIVGALGPGIGALTSGRLAQIVGPRRHKQVWGQATGAFAAAQAASGYIMSSGYELLGTYTPLYGVASGLLAVGAVLVMVSGKGIKQKFGP